METSSALPKTAKPILIIYCLLVLWLLRPPAACLLSAVGRLLHIV